MTGGLPDLSEIDPEAMEEDPTAYEGCLRGLQVNAKTYQLNELGRRRLYDQYNIIMMYIQFLHLRVQHNTSY